MAAYVVEIVARAAADLNALFRIVGKRVFILRVVHRSELDRALRELR